MHCVIVCRHAIVIVARALWLVIKFHFGAYNAHNHLFHFFFYYLLRKLRVHVFFLLCLKQFKANRILLGLNAHNLCTAFLAFCSVCVCGSVVTILFGLLLHYLPFSVLGDSIARHLDELEKNKCREMQCTH